MRFPSVSMLVAAFLLSACATPSVSPSGQPDPIAAFQRKEARIFEIGHTLVVANATECATTQPSIGMLIHDAQAYKSADKVKQLLGLSGDIGVQAVASGSPAAKAGIVQNDTLLMIDSLEVDEQPDTRDWQRSAALRQSISTSLNDGSVDLTWRDAPGRVHQAAIAPEFACASAFELVSGRSDARADGMRVLIGEHFVGFDYAVDELAAVLAHELAHNLLGHVEARPNWSIRQIRLSEREADRLAPWLLANAGYDPAAIVRMLKRWGPRHGGGILRKPTHDGWDERVEYLEEELHLVEASGKTNVDGGAAWNVLFQRESLLTRPR